MADRPILFSAPMIRALLAGTKTQTRRVIKPRGKHPSLFDGNSSDSYVLDPGNEDWRQTDIPIKMGDRLWVRETWQGLTFGNYRPTKQEPCEVRYAATDPCADLDAEARGYIWRPSIFMPRFASRLTLSVTDVRVERLQDIIEADAIAEGIERAPYGNWKCYGETPKPFGGAAPTVLAHGMGTVSANPFHSYATLWDSINGPGAWDANPWIVAYGFTVHHGNVDQIAQVAA